MPIRPIRLFGDPVLRTPAVPVVDFDKELRTLVADLTDTMVNAPGAGLAAPQLGVGLRVFTWNVHGELGHLVGVRPADQHRCPHLPGAVRPGVGGLPHELQPQPGRGGEALEGARDQLVVTVRRVVRVFFLRACGRAAAEEKGAREREWGG